MASMDGWDDTRLNQYDKSEQLYEPEQQWRDGLGFFQLSSPSVCENNIASGSDMDGISRRWEDMDRDCLVNIFSRVPTPDLLLSLPFVCKAWHRASLNPRCWACLDLSNIGRAFPDYDSLDYDFLYRFPLSGLLKFVASRSQGRATAILMPWGSWSDEYFMEPQDFAFIMDALKGLRVLVCGRMSEEENQVRLAEVIDRWTDLESFSIGEDQPHLAQTLAAVARGCPRFQHLHLFDMNLSQRAAAAIAEGLGPRLTYLRLVDVFMEKEDLLSILRACKGLRTLHIANCYGFMNDEPDVLECGAGVQKFFYRPSEPLSDGDWYGTENSRDFYDGNSDIGYQL